MKRYFTNISPYICFLILSIVLIVVWFKDGLYIGGGDVGLPFYKPELVFQTVKYIWWDINFPGYVYVNTLSAAPLYFFLGLIGLTGIGLEKLIFGAVLFTTLSFSYLFFNQLQVGNISKFFGLIFAFVYTFNPFSLFHVWHRFVQTGIIMYMLLPLSGYLYLRFIKRLKYRYYLLFLLSTIFLSYVFGTPAFVVVLWLFILVLFIYSSFAFKTTFKQKSIWTVLLALGWVVTNFWWILPIFVTSQNLLLGYSSITENLKNFLALGSYTTLKDVFRGINVFHINSTNLWLGLYKTWLFNIFSWLFAFLSFIGFWFATRRRHTTVLAISWLILLFLTKGSAGPFALVSTLLFKSSFFFGVIRNPYEKLGLITFFLSSIIVTLGIHGICVVLERKRLLLKFLSITAIIVYLSYLWPFWTGRVFGDDETGSYVNPPTAYEKLADWLQGKPTDYSILRLPLASGGVTFNWEPIYSGTDPFPGLFANPTLFKYMAVNYVDSSLEDLERVIRDRPADEWVNSLKRFNIKYIIIHNDIAWRERNSLNVKTISEKIKKATFITEVANFDDLVVFEVDNKIFESKIVLVNDPPVVYNTSSKESHNEAGLLSNFINSSSVDVESYGERIIYPVDELYIPNFKYTLAENAAKELSAFRYLPTEMIYPLIALKEQIIKLQGLPDEEIYNEFIFAGKRLAETIALFEKNKIPEASKNLAKYQMNMISVIRHFDLIKTKIRQDSTEDRVFRSNFARHYFALEQLKNKYTTPLTNNTFDWYRDELKRYMILPNTEFGQNFNYINKRIYRFSVPQDGQYNLNIPVSDVYQGVFLSPAILQTKDNTVYASYNDRNLDYGNIKLTKGVFEVLYTPPESQVLIPKDLSSWELTRVEVNEEGELVFSSTASELAGVSVDIENFNPETTYEITFQFWIELGSGVTLRIEHDSDMSDTDYKKSAYQTTFTTNDYNLFWNDASWQFTTKNNSKSAKLKLMVNPWNYCIKELKDKKKCELLGELYQKPSKVHVRNVSIKQIHKYAPVLSKPEEKMTQTKQISFRKINATLTEFDLDVEGGSYLIFKEAYHPGWKLYLDDVATPEEDHLLANGYANAWYIKTPGKYKAKIYFRPQGNLRNMVFVSAATSLTFITICYLYSRRNLWKD